MTVAGILHGVGVGPGDPELLTLKAARLLASARVVVFFAKRGQGGNARRIVAAHLGQQAELLRLDYPFTTEVPIADAAYLRDMGAFYDRAAEQVAEKLRTGADVAVLCEGDPLFYGSFMYLHDRLAGEFRCEITPGITSMSGGWSRVGAPMTRGDDTLAVLSATLDEDRLTQRLTGADAAVIMKIGRNLAKVRAALTRAGLISRAIYVERGTMPEERIVKLADKRDDKAPYFSIVLVPTVRKTI